MKTTLPTYHQISLCLSPFVTYFGVDVVRGGGRLVVTGAERLRIWYHALFNCSVMKVYNYHIQISLACSLGLALGGCLFMGSGSYGDEAKPRLSIFFSNELYLFGFFGCAGSSLPCRAFSCCRAGATL